MRVAIDVSPLEKNSPHHIRGSGFYLRNLLENLEKINDLDLMTFTNRTDIERGIKTVHFPYFEPFFVTLPLKRHYKMIVTVHDLTPIVLPNEFPVGIKGSVKWQIQKNLLAFADAIITDSDSSKKDIIRIVGIPAGKVRVIPLAAADHFKKLALSHKKEEELKQKYALPEKFLFYVGDVTANKNLPRLIRAVKRLNIPLFLAGKSLVAKDYDKKNPWNVDRNAVHELLSDSENIRLLGFVPDDDLVTLYNLATVFVMPSLYEGFGLPVLEALQCGTPVITANAGSLPEVAGDAAIYVDPYNEDDIREKIKALYADVSMQRKLSEKGLLQAKNFSWSKTADLTYKAYKTIAS